MKYLCNVFTLSMLAHEDYFIRSRAVPQWQFVDSLNNINEFTSAVGHDATAAVLTERLQLDIQKNRIDVSLTPDDMLYVAEFKTPRLAEGEILSAERTRELDIKYWIVTIQRDLLG